MGDRVPDLARGVTDKHSGDPYPKSKNGPVRHVVRDGKPVEPPPERSLDQQREAIIKINNFQLTFLEAAAANGLPLTAEQFSTLERVARIVKLMSQALPDGADNEDPIDWSAQTAK